MDTRIQAALEQQAERVGIIDKDCVRAFPSITNELTVAEDGSVDESAIREAVRAMKQRSPKLFLEVEWDRMDDTRFREQERKFRDSLRPAPKNQQNEFALVDAALCDEKELAALRRYLGGHGSSYERSILQNALHKQRRMAGDAA